MRHLITFETYHDKYLGSILDKINNSGINSLSNLEREYLDAYSNDDENRMNLIEHSEECKTFHSNDSNFIFKLKDIKYNGNLKKIYGTITVPNLDSNNKIKVDIDGYIVVYPNHQVVLFFEKENQDIFEFCNGLEYELDSFIDYVISTIEDENTIG